MPPLKHGTSDAVVSHNISEMAKAGHPVAQAVAAALRMKDESKKYKYAEGGDVAPQALSMDDTGNAHIIQPTGVPSPTPAMLNEKTMKYEQPQPPAPQFAQGGEVQHFDNGGGAALPDSSSASPDPMDQILGNSSSASHADTASIAEQAGLPAVLEEIKSKGGSGAISALGNALVSSAEAAEPTPTPTSSSLPFPLPNGGLTGPALESYIKSNPGPVATTGVNPSANNATPEAKADDEEEDKGTTQAPSAAPSKVAPTSSSEEEVPAKVAPTTQSSVNPLLVKYLQDREDMKNAQSQSEKMRLNANLARMGALLASSAYGSTRPVEEAGLKSLDEQANIPVQNQQNIQAAGMKGIQEQQAMMAAQSTQDASNPDSSKSRAFRASIEKLAPGIAKAYGADWKNVAAEDSNLITKPIEMREQMDARKQAAHDALMYKQSTGQDKAYTQMRKDLETFRGNPAAQQAAVATQNVDKALALTGSQPTSQNLNLLAEEMGKIAAGGVPGEHGVHALLPDNLATKVAELKAFALSTPSNADVSAYLKNNVDYLKQVKTIANSTLTAYRGNIAKGYKGRVTPENYSEAQSDYGYGGPTAGATTSSGGQSNTQAQPVPRKTADGRVALFDPSTKAFLGYQ
jgi:hypothetical protein